MVLCHITLPGPSCADSPCSLCACVGSIQVLPHSKTSTSGEGQFGPGCTRPSPKLPGMGCTEEVVMVCIPLSLSSGPVQGVPNKVAAECGEMKAHQWLFVYSYCVYD